MAQPVWLKKYLRMSPEVNRIYNDLDAWRDHCRINMMKFDERDLYKSRDYKEFAKRQIKG